METPKEYYYTYYSYEEWGRGYFGSRGCNCLPEEDIKYFGSFSDTNFNPTQKIILKSDYTTREEAYVDEIILQQYYKVVENPHFANKSYQTSTKFYVPREQAIKNGKIGGEIGGKMCYELGLGFYGLSEDEMHRIRKEVGSISGRKNYELGIGIHAQTPEERKIVASKGGKIGGKNGGKITGKLVQEKHRKNGTGFYGLTTEQRKEYTTKGANTKFMCLETGHITNAGALTNYQRARGIDTSKRKRVE